MRFMPLAGTCSRLALGACLLVAPQWAGAADDDVREQLRRMNERMTQMEDRLQATTDELQTARETVATQQQVMEEAGLAEDRGALSALSAFLEATDFSGWVASSYNYNLGNIDSSGNDGIVGQNLGSPFHPDSNTFQVDQAWFVIDKAVSEESRGGFHIDLLYGKTATLLGGNDVDFPFGNDGVELFTAYASYLVPLGDTELRIDMGELATLIGAEVVQSPYNFNITRGWVWGIQPVTHTGVIATLGLTNGMSVSAGFVNDGFSDADLDTDNNKAFTGQIAIGDDVYGAAANIVYGSPITGPGLNLEGDKVGIFDVVLTADPSENLSLWVNFDYLWADDVPGLGDAEIYAVAVAGRLAVLDTTGISLRGEVLKEDDGALGLGGDGELYSLTATLDHALTENLTARLEGRFDFSDADGGSNDFFLNQDGFATRDTQAILLAELIYAF